MAIKFLNGVPKDSTSRDSIKRTLHPLPPQTVFSNQINEAPSKDIIQKKEFWFSQPRQTAFNYQIKEASSRDISGLLLLLYCIIVELIRMSIVQFKCVCKLQLFKCNVLIRIVGVM